MQDLGLDPESIARLVADLINDHWVKMLVGLGVFLAGRWWGRFRAARAWKRREFLHRIMVSLNSIKPSQNGNPTLAIRTLLECDLEEVLLNSTAATKLLKFATRTTERQPVIPIPQADRWYFLNAVLNQVAEKYSHGNLAQDIGVASASRSYLVCLTNETAGPVRTHKIRAMVMRKDQFIAGEFQQAMNIEQPHHRTRLETLKVMRRTYTESPDLFIELELSIPASRLAVPRAELVRALRSA